MGTVKSKQTRPVFNKGCYDTTGLTEYVKQKREINNNPYYIKIYLYECQRFINKISNSHFQEDEIEKLISEVFADKPHTITMVGFGVSPAFVVQFVQGIIISS